MILPEKHTNGYGEVIQIEKNFYLQQIYKIPYIHIPNLYNLIKLAIFIGAYKAITNKNIKNDKSFKLYVRKRSNVYLDSIIKIENIREIYKIIGN